jgi:hypothetical protein
MLRSNRNVLERTDCTDAQVMLNFGCSLFKKVLSGSDNYVLYFKNLAYIYI